MINFVNKNNLEECRKSIQNKEVLGVDTETTGLDPHSSKVIMFQIGDENEQWVIDTRVVSIESIKDILKSKNILKLFHNSKFDWKHIYSSFGIEIENLYDTMLAEMILYNGLDHRVSLDRTVKKYLDKNMPKTVRGEFARIGDEPFTDKQIEYGARDIEVLSKIYRYQKELLKDWDLLSEMDLENKFIITLAKMEYNGFYLDPNKWREVVNNKREEQKDVMRRVDEWILNNGPEEYIDRNPTLFTNEPRPVTHIKRGKNYKYLFSSQNEVVKFMNKLGIDTLIEDKEKGGYKHSVEESNLRRFEDQSSFIPLYLEYKGIEKSLTTYGENFLQNINKNTGRVHSDYNPIISTGRLSSKSPNLQNIPSTEDYRSCFAPQYNENILVVGDYSQQEPRVVAHLSGDKKFIDFFNNDFGDSHSFVSSIISEFSEGERIEVSKKNNPISKKFGKPIRDIGKMINLSLNYGKGAYSLQFDLNCTQEEAQKVIDTVQGELTGLKEYMDRTKKKPFEDGYIVADPKTGRKCFIERFEEFEELREEVENFDWEHYREEKEKDSDRFRNYLKPTISKYFKWKGNIERDALNYPVQGTSASITKYAMILLDRIFKERDLPAWIVATIHDEIVVECRENISEEVRDLVKEKMEAAGHVFCPSVKILAEPVITNKWEH